MKTSHYTGFMKLFEKLFGNMESKDPRKKDLKEVEALFAAVSGNDAKYLACFSLLLAKVADADNEITEGERARIKVLLAKYAELSASYAEVVATTALKTTLAKSVDLKLICDELYKCTNKEQRKNAMRSCLYVATDDGISETEIQEMHVIARFLRFSDKEWEALLAEFSGTGTEQAS
jgi:uncharacterized tellurite resistance protein B-like protein